MAVSKQSNSLRLPSCPRFKCIILGASGAGKSCLFDRIIYDRFSDIPRYKARNFTLTSVVDTRLVPVPSGDIATVQLWDAVGGDRSGILPGNYFSGARAVLLVYDVTNYPTCGFLSKYIWQTEDRLCHNDEPLYFVVGTKMDLGVENGKFAETAKTFFQEKEVSDWFCVSSKTGENVKEMIQTVAERALEKLPKNNGVVTLSAEENKESVKKRCC